MAQQAPKDGNKKQKRSILELVNLKTTSAATPNRGGTGVPMADAPFLSQYKGPLKVRTLRKDGMPSLIRGTLPTTNLANSRSKEQVIFTYLDALKAPIRIEQPSEEFQITKQLKDEVGKTHIKLQQTFKGLKVYGGEAWVHTDKEGSIDLFSGLNYPSPQLTSTTPSIDKANALAIALTDVAEHTTIVPMNTQDNPLLQHLEDKAELVVYHVDQDLEKEHLAWALKIHPNRVSHWNYFVDAHTGEVLNHHSTLCQLYHGVGMDKEAHSQEVYTKEAAAINTGNSAFFDGPESTQATDINGVTQMVNSYSTNGTNFLIDTSKPMYNSRNSSLPDDPIGAIWTLDARNASPSSRNGFQPHHVTSNSTRWDDGLAVSAHTNASRTYDYFLNKHGRNSVNDRGINIISFINVADEDGQGLDNAFWDGQYIYYGNGGGAFSPLAGALDVAGHEISHGVIQNTANLQYQGESGALNESFADVFAVLIEDFGEAQMGDLRIGEDVVNTQQFPSGALRDIQNPHNGGSRLGDPGWQPESVSEQFFGREDNGGVHINSGITNHAFYLYLVDEQLGEINANAAKIEKIYYKALTNYLNSRSNFQHLRESIILSARDLHGADSEEVRAADRAFTGVGITQPSVASIIGTTTPTEEDIPEEVEENIGNDFIVYTDGDSTRLYIANGAGTLQVTLDEVGVSSRPSITDDGTRIIFVDGNQTLRDYKINWETGTISKIDFIDENPIWRNACISRDGRRLAAVTLETNQSDLDNRVYIFDLVNNTGRAFELYNPTYTEGITTGTVQYAEALEFDFTGESVMYDALNTISGDFGASIAGTPGNSELTYWDIGFLKVWENDTNSWEEDTENNIRKLYSGLPKDDSVGNPTFSKN